MTTQTIYDALTTYGRKRILESYAQDSCIAATRIAMRVMQRFGIQSFAMPCQVAVYTNPLWERLQREGEVPDGWKPGPGEWSVGIGVGPFTKTPTRGKGFHGHLVAVTDPDRGMLVDLAVDQASRPEKQMTAPSLAFEFDGRPILKQLEQCIVTYRFTPDNTVYRNAPDWNRNQHAIEEIALDITDFIYAQD